MEPIVILPAQQLEEIIQRYENATTRLIEAEKDLAALKEDRYVNWKWVCQFFGIDLKTAKLMLAEEKLFVHNKQIKRFKKSVILAFAERNSVKVKDVYTMNYR